MHSHCSKLFTHTSSGIVNHVFRVACTACTAKLTGGSITPDVVAFLACSPFTVLSGEEDVRFVGLVLLASSDGAALVSELLSAIFAIVPKYLYEMFP